MPLQIVTYTSCRLHCIVLNKNSSAVSNADRTQASRTSKKSLNLARKRENDMFRPYFEIQLLRSNTTKHVCSYVGVATPGMPRIFHLPTIFCNSIVVVDDLIDSIKNIFLKVLSISVS